MWLKVHSPAQNGVLLSRWSLFCLFPLSVTHTYTSLANLTGEKCFFSCTFFFIARLRLRRHCSGVNPPKHPERHGSPGDPSRGLQALEVHLPCCLPSHPHRTGRSLGSSLASSHWQPPGVRMGPEIPMVGERVRMASVQTLHYLCLATAVGTHSFPCSSDHDSRMFRMPSFPV